MCECGGCIKNVSQLVITGRNLVMMTIMIMAMVMMGYTEKDNETLCCRIMIMIMKMTSFFCIIS